MAIDSWNLWKFSPSKKPAIRHIQKLRVRSMYICMYVCTYRYIYHCHTTEKFEKGKLRPILQIRVNLPSFNQSIYMRTTHTYVSTIIKCNVKECFEVVLSCVAVKVRISQFESFLCPIASICRYYRLCIANCLETDEVTHYVRVYIYCIL